MDRRHGLPDDRLRTQVLADPDRGLADLGLQAGPFPLTVLDAVALVAEEVEGGGQFPHVGRAAGHRARLRVTERATAYRRSDAVQRATDPAQAHGHGDYREHEAEGQDGRGPAQADAQGAPAPRREHVALLRQVLPQRVRPLGERAGARRGLAVEPGREHAAPRSRRRPVVGAEGGQRGALFGRDVAAHRGLGQPVHLAERPAEGGPFVPVVRQQAGRAGGLVSGDRTLRVQEAGHHGQVGHLDRLDLAAELLDGGALVGGPGEHEDDHGGGQHRLHGQPGPGIEDDRARLPHGIGVPVFFTRPRRGTWRGTSRNRRPAPGPMALQRNIEELPVSLPSK